MRPPARQMGGSGMIDLARNISLFVTGTRTTDEDTQELRVLAGRAYRLR